MVPNRRQKPGVTTWVAVRPCDDTRTYLGVLVGDIATMLDVRYNSSAGVMEVAPALYNPAIWVPDLARLVFGLGSWWGVITTPDGLRQITDADISNVWYVRALRDMGG